MKTLHFRCHLLTDIILNQHAATVGNQESLDFIPGNNFLGVAAGQLYFDRKGTGRLSNEDSLIVFHSGKVRFGDAHPEKKESGMRTLRIPASMYKPKLDNEEGLYIHHEVKDTKKKEFKDFQPKQCRTGFFLFENNQIEEVEVNKSFAIKSAYDKNYRRSADEKMYGYESLNAGSNWLFEVLMDDDVFAESIKNALVGVRRIGRSRTAQYGLVKINEVNYTETAISRECNTDFALVYADSRLIFLDEYGLPTFQPDAGDLGFKNGEIDWCKSQILTFQYAPWNFRRQARDTDRCGIEKGSVFYIKKKSDQPLDYKEKQFVGCYQNEGFGKVILNPEFLEAEPDPNANGKALFKLKKKDNADQEKNNIERKSLAVSEEDGILIKYLKQQNNSMVNENEILKLINGFVEENASLYRSDTFASQWGKIRSLSVQYKTKSKIIEALFTKQETVDGQIKPAAYLTRGVAKDKWDEQKRRDKFKEFIEQFSGENFYTAIINLSTEMAKIAKGGTQNER